MIEVVLQFTVKEEARGRFELTFGPGGAWSSLFAKSPGFRGTTLLRDTDDPRRYLVIDLWDSVEQRQQALTERRAECASLRTAFSGWTEKITELGAFRVVAEATVQPRGRTRRTPR